MTDEEKRAVNVAIEAGHILLENGAEISRVEQTMDIMAGTLGVKEHSFFVLSNGIISTAGDYARAEFIPIKGTQLSRVAEVNWLSRRIASGEERDIGRIEQLLHTIRTSPGKAWWELTLGVALGVATFCILFGGSLIDALATFSAGLLLGLFISFAMPYLSRIVGNLLGGLVGGLLCIGAYRLGFGQHLPNMIVGTIIALVPGVPFTNGIRDLANEDYIAGGTRLLDAFTAFLCIALGVSLSLLIDGTFMRGIIKLEPPVFDALTAIYPIQIASALIGTIGFAVMFGTPRRFYFVCGLVGAAGWLVYLLILRAAGADGALLFSPVFAAFGGSFIVTFASHIAARLCRCASTVFLICGIIPLVPGGGIFWTAYYLVTNQLAEAAATGFMALKVTIAIAGGIIIAAGIFKRIWKDKITTK